jgi:hypothetical protein
VRLAAIFREPPDNPAEFRGLAVEPDGGKVRFGLFSFLWTLDKIHDMFFNIDST